MVKKPVFYGLFHMCMGGPCLDAGEHRPLECGARHTRRRVLHGAIAQLGERYNGIVEVSGSIPLSSTNLSSTIFPNRFVLSPSSRGLGHHPFTVVTRVRIPVGTPFKKQRPARVRAFAF